MGSIIDKLEQERPSFHDDGKGGLTSWNSNTNLLRAVEHHLSPGMRTLELGSGYSTVTFLHNGCRHTSISPVRAESERIAAYCRKAGVSLDNMEFCVGESYDFLPGMARGGFDFIFIDGAHRFPFPIVDWFFCAMLLKNGGLIVIDDTDIVSCHIVLRFMMNDSHWEPVDVRENFGIFRKKGDHNYPFDWQGQSFGKEKIVKAEDLLNALYPEKNAAREDEAALGQVNAAPMASALCNLETGPPPLSVIICTFNRADLLRVTLDSLVRQTLGRDKYEVIVIDDGSSDGTRQCVESFAGRLPIKYFFQRNAGLASAKNHGIFAARGEILFFMDDDDLAAPTLLEEHLKTHAKYPDNNYAVLNYTAWAPDLDVTPLMHFITEVGCFLFSYPYIKHGDVLDYTNFWGGRSSCKRSFLIEHGVFNPVFRFGCEDIELGYRLSKQGLRVVYNSKAVSYMTRTIGFDDFCTRLIKQGRSQYVFSSLHDDPAVHQWAEMVGAEERWARIQDFYEAKRNSAKGLDKIANAKLQLKLGLDDATRKLLYQAYWWVFRACKLKGIDEAGRDRIPEEKRDAPGSSDGAGYSAGTTHGTFAPGFGISTAVITSGPGYRHYASAMKDEYLRRRGCEKSFITGSGPFSVKGRCYVCRREARFSVDYTYSYLEDGVPTPNWREHLVCSRCILNNRMRAAIHLFEGLLRPNPESNIYISEQTTPLYKWLASNYRNVTGSEYLDDRVPYGLTDPVGIRNESMTGLTFPDGAFDFVLSFDVFEHIPDFQKAFRECLRVLNQTGILFFTVPFETSSEKNIVRALIKDDGRIDHLLPPEYHGDPISKKGCLAFYRFGWEMLGQLKEAGFARAEAHFYWSDVFGYLGDNQVVFIAMR